MCNMNTMGRYTPVLNLPLFLDSRVDVFQTVGTQVSNSKLGSMRASHCLASQPSCFSGEDLKYSKHSSLYLEFSSSKEQG